MNASRPSQTLLLDALAARFGGTAYAVHQLSRALLARPEIRELIVVTRAESIVAQAMRKTGPATVVLLPELARGELAMRTAWQISRLPGLVSDLNVTGVFSFSGIVPRALPAPMISLLANPVPYEDRDWLGSRVRRAAIARTSHRAVASYVPSQHLASLVAPLPRVAVVPLGVDRSVFFPSDQAGDYFLYVADFYRHKHHDLLLKAYASVPQPRPFLRLLGNPAVDRDWYHRVLQLARDVPGVSLEGRVSFAVLRDAYRGALGFVITSDRESFSMPVAEAVCCGLPVVARDHPVLRETAGSAGLFVDSTDPQIWGRALQRLVEDLALRRRLAAGAREHARRYSWGRMAAQIVADFSEAKR